MATSSKPLIGNILNHLLDGENDKLKLHEHHLVATPVRIDASIWEKLSQRSADWMAYITGELSKAFESFEQWLADLPESTFWRVTTEWWDNLLRFSAEMVKAVKSNIRYLYEQFAEIFMYLFSESMGFVQKAGATIKEWIAQLSSLSLVKWAVRGLKILVEPFKMIGKYIYDRICPILFTKKHTLVSVLATSTATAICNAVRVLRNHEVAIEVAGVYETWGAGQKIAYNLSLYNELYVENTECALICFERLMSILDRVVQLGAYVDFPEELLFYCRSALRAVAENNSVEIINGNDVLQHVGPALRRVIQQDPAMANTVVKNIINTEVFRELAGDVCRYLLRSYCPVNSLEKATTPPAKEKVSEKEFLAMIESYSKRAEQDSKTAQELTNIKLMYETLKKKDSIAETDRKDFVMSYIKDFFPNKFIRPIKEYDARQLQRDARGYDKIDDDDDVTDLEILERIHIDSTDMEVFILEQQVQQFRMQTLSRGVDSNKFLEEMFPVVRNLTQGLPTIGVRVLTTSGSSGSMGVVYDDIMAWREAASNKSLGHFVTYINEVESQFKDGGYKSRPNFCSRRDLEREEVERFHLDGTQDYIFFTMYKQAANVIFRNYGDLNDLFKYFNDFNNAIQQYDRIEQLLTWDRRFMVAGVIVGLSHVIMETFVSFAGILKPVPRYISKNDIPAEELNKAREAIQYFKDSDKTTPVSAIFSRVWTAGQQKVELADIEAFSLALNDLEKSPIMRSAWQTKAENIFVYLKNAQDDLLEGYRKRFTGSVNQGVLLQAEINDLDQAQKLFDFGTWIYNTYPQIKALHHYEQPRNFFNEFTGIYATSFQNINQAAFKESEVLVLKETVAFKEITYEDKYTGTTSLMQFQQLFAPRMTEVEIVKELTWEAEKQLLTVYDSDFFLFNAAKTINPKVTTDLITPVLTTVDSFDELLNERRVYDNVVARLENIYLHRDQRSPQQYLDTEPLDDATRNYLSVALKYIVGDTDESLNDMGQQVENIPPIIDQFKTMRSTVNYYLSNSKDEYNKVMNLVNKTTSIDALWVQVASYMKNLTDPRSYNDFVNQAQVDRQHKLNPDQVATLAKEISETQEHLGYLTDLKASLTGTSLPLGIDPDNVDSLITQRKQHLAVLQTQQDLNSNLGVDSKELLALRENAQLYSLFLKLEDGSEFKEFLINNASIIDDYLNNPGKDSVAMHQITKDLLKFMKDPKYTQFTSGFYYSIVQDDISIRERINLGASEVLTWARNEQIPVLKNTLVNNLLTFYQEKPWVVKTDANTFALKQLGVDVGLAEQARTLRLTETQTALDNISNDLSTYTTVNQDYTRVIGEYKTRVTEMLRFKDADHDAIVDVLKMFPGDLPPDEFLGKHKLVTELIRHGNAVYFDLRATLLYPKQGLNTQQAFEQRLPVIIPNKDYTAEDIIEMSNALYNIKVDHALAANIGRYCINAVNGYVKEEESWLRKENGRSIRTNYFKERGYTYEAYRGEEIVKEYIAEIRARQTSQFHRQHTANAVTVKNLKKWIDILQPEITKYELSAAKDKSPAVLAKLAKLQKLDKILSADYRDISFANLVEIDTLRNNFIDRYVDIEDWRKLDPDNFGQLPLEDQFLRVRYGMEMNFHNQRINRCQPFNENTDLYNACVLKSEVIFHGSVRELAKKIHDTAKTLAHRELAANVYEAANWYYKEATTAFHALEGYLEITPKDEREEWSEFAPWDFSKPWKEFNVDREEEMFVILQKRLQSKRDDPAEDVWRRPIKDSWAKAWKWVTSPVENPLTAEVYTDKTLGNSRLTRLYDRIAAKNIFEYFSSGLLLYSAASTAFDAAYNLANIPAPSSFIGARYQGDPGRLHKPRTYTTNNFNHLDPTLAVKQQNIIQKVLKAVGLDIDFGKYRSPIGVFKALINVAGVVVSAKTIYSFIETACQLGLYVLSPSTLSSIEYDVGLPMAWTVLVFSAMSVLTFINVAEIGRVIHLNNDQALVDTNARLFTNFPTLKGDQSAISITRSIGNLARLFTNISSLFQRIDGNTFSLIKDNPGTVAFQGFTSAFSLAQSGRTLLQVYRQQNFTPLGLLDQLRVMLNSYFGGILPPVKNHMLKTIHDNFQTLTIEQKRDPDVVLRKIGYSWAEMSASEIGRSPQAYADIIRERIGRFNGPPEITSYFALTLDELLIKDLDRLIDALSKVENMTQRDEFIDAFIRRRAARYMVQIYISKVQSKVEQP